jgi:putative oxidoreductase
MKIFDMGVGKFVEMGSPMIPSWLGPGLGKPYLYAVPFMEFLVGLLVTLGLLTRAVATIMSLMLLSFMIAATGFFPKEKPFEPNIILMSLAIALALAGPGRFSLDAIIFANSRRGREPIQRAG